MRSLVVGSRGSKLALCQTGTVIESLGPDISCEVRVIRTTGDRVTDRPLSSIGDKGLFVKEIQQVLLTGEIDFAVHSAKDLPSEIDPALCLAAYPARENSADVLISRCGSLSRLPNGARVGTSSVRRRAQLLHARPDLNMIDLRGNLDTRLRKLDDGEYDAIVLARAGLARMGWESRVTEVLSHDQCLPAVGQGALAVQCRTDSPVLQMLDVLDDPATRCCVTAERAFLAGLNAGCLTPVAASARVVDSRIEMDALVAASNGSQVVRRSVSGDISEAQSLGVELASWFLASSARELLDEARLSAGPKGIGAA